MQMQMLLPTPKPRPVVSSGEVRGRHLEKALLVSDAMNRSEGVFGTAARLGAAGVDRGTGRWLLSRQDLARKLGTSGQDWWGAGPLMGEGCRVAGGGPAGWLGVGDGPGSGQPNTAAAHRAVPASQCPLL